MKSTWSGAMARRVGLSGQMDFTPTRVGMTLHIHCQKGDHDVDFDVLPGMHPDQVAKRMLGKGWTIGRYLACPEHSRKEKVKPMKVAVDVPVVAQPVEAPVVETPVAAPIPTAPSKKRNHPGNGYWQSRPPEERAAHVERMNAARLAKHQAAKPAPIQQKEPEPMASAVIEFAPVADTAVVTATAKAARRDAHDAIAITFDISKGRYKDGYSDDRIAKENGVSLDWVRRRREDEFGPLETVPPEITEARKALAMVRDNLSNLEADYQARLYDAHTRVTVVSDKLATLCRARGWPEVA